MDGAGNESRSRLQKNWVRLVNTFWQNGDRKDGKGLSYFSCILFLLAGHPSLSWWLYFSEENYDSFYRTSIEHTLPTARLEFNFEGMPAIKTCEVSCYWRGMFWYVRTVSQAVLAAMLQVGGRGIWQAGLTSTSIAKDICFYWLACFTRISRYSYIKKATVQSLWREMKNH